MKEEEAAWANRGFSRLDEWVFRKMTEKEGLVGISAELGEGLANK